MAKGYHGRILRVDLSTNKSETFVPGDRFYRTYLGGGLMSAWFTAKETAADTDPFSPSNVLCIMPSVTTGSPVSGASRVCVSALSPLTGCMGDGQAGGSFGPAIKRAGWDGIVITGKAEHPCYLYVTKEGVEIRDASDFAYETAINVYDRLSGILGGRGVSIMQCGPAGMRLVRFACLLADCNDVIGRTGMGAVFGSKNLRAVGVRGDGEIAPEDAERLKSLNKLAAERLPESGFPAILRKHGTPGVVGIQAEAGNLASFNYSRSFHPEYKKLDANSFKPEMRSRETTCYGCVVRCRKSVKLEKPYAVSDRLGGPEFETMGLLGSNLDITDPEAVAAANELCNNLGIDTITTGCIAGYLFECMEKGLITPDMVDGRKMGFKDVESLFRLIELIASREGTGRILGEGFDAMIKHFGEATAPYAIHVKNQGLAIHMPQVKPSQALMYATCPIGPDHQSSEHDWLLTGGGENAKALGIYGDAESSPTGPDKVRMTVYSQFYYSLLDTLSLCMFCWGPGNLFTYRELEDLVNACTGWQTSLFELMKAGERRVTLMRWINARRGFTRKEDILPKRLNDPLPDGPKAGHRVDPEAFEEMLDRYYAFLGWDPKTGVPSEGKLMELDLEWAI